MHTDSPLGTAHRPGLIWGFDFAEGAARPVSEEALAEGRPAEGAFRWLHFSLADQRTRRWLAAADLPKPAIELLLSPDPHQRYVIKGPVLAAVLHDAEQDFVEADPHPGVFRFVLTPTLMLTARHHPVRCAEAVKQRILNGANPHDAHAALEVMFAALGETQRAVVVQLDDAVQKMEDDLLADRPPPSARAFLEIRTLMVRVHRALSGMRAVFHRLEDDNDLAKALQPSVAKFSQRIAQADAELLSVQSQLRLLREELDLQAAQRTNQTLNTLSVLTALLMPATLVTGVFGMNTGGFPWDKDPHGTLYATLLAFGASAAVYVGLRLLGYLRR